MKRAPVHRTMVFYCCMHEKCEWQYVRNTIDLICFLNISIVSKILKFPCLSLSLCLSAFMRFVFDAKISYLQFVFNICAKENDCHGIWLIHWTQPNNQAQQKEYFIKNYSILFSPRQKSKFFFRPILLIHRFYPQDEFLLQNNATSTIKMKR